MQRALTDADLAVLGPLAENRFLIAAQLAALLDVSEAAAARRLRRLRDAGLVSFGPLPDRGGQFVATATRAGLRRIGAAANETRLDRVNYRHDLDVGWLWLAARAGAFGPLTRIVTDRQMRGADGARTRAPDLEPPNAIPHGIGLGLLGPRGQIQRHYPDLLLRTASGHEVAIELELTRKSTRRVERIMTAYASDARIDAVLYLVPSAAIASAVADAAARVGVSELVHVQRLAPERERSTAPAASSARFHAVTGAGRVGPRRGPGARDPGTRDRAGAER